MLTLYYAPGAASLVVHWLLIETGAAHELRKLDLQAKEHKTPAYLAINPQGVVPTLIVDDRPMVESVAMVLHLCDAFPEAGFAPAPGTRARADFYQWLLIMANQLQPAFRTWFYPAEAAGEEAAEAAKEIARERIEAIFSRFDAQLAAHGPYLLGGKPSGADFMLTMLMRWSRNMPKPATSWPALAALAQAMKARPSFRTLYEREGLSEWA